MSAATLGTWLRTLWYLRGAQWRGQARRALARGHRPKRWTGAPPRLGLRAPAVPYLGASAHVGIANGRLRLLNRELALGEGIDWGFRGEGPLFAYHLHQFEWARHTAVSPAERLAAMQSWCEGHREGVGWDGGPTSLRSIAWLRLLATSGALPEDASARDALLRSLADQLTTLAANLETHLLANHYLWNLLALVFAGVACDGDAADRWLAHAPMLRSELAEQILPDGAHYERSPMYHALLLEHLLDLANAMQARGGRAPAGLEEQVRETAARMLGAHSVWTHPDGEIALFGDAAFGIAHAPAALGAYAAALRIAPHLPQPANVLRDAGFVRLTAGPFTLIATASPPSPTYQPGHAHCDALSFELSVAGERVVTDTGVCEYAPGARRDLSRATRSHATVEVDGREQAELWAAHRVGGRPDVAFTRADAQLAIGVCASWSTPAVLHRRTFEVEPGGVRLHDHFDRPALRARLVLPLAPGLEPRLAGAQARIALARGGELRIALPAAARWRTERMPYFPEFGREIERTALVGEAESLAEAEWRIDLE